MLRVEIKEGFHLPEMISGVSGAGKAYTFYKQSAYVDLGKAYPEEITINHNQPSDAYPVGVYTLEMSSFKVEKGRLQIDLYNLKLKPLNQAKAA